MIRHNKSTNVEYRQINYLVYIGKVDSKLFLFYLLMSNSAKRCENGPKITKNVSNANYWTLFDSIQP